MNSWRDFWTASKTRVWVYHFVLLPLVIVLYLLVLVPSVALERGSQAIWKLCCDLYDCSKVIAARWSFSYRVAMKQTKGGAQ